MFMDHGSTWARVRNRETGEGGWFNLQSEEVITDPKMRSLIQANMYGVVVGDPTESGAWLSAERGAEAALGVSVR